MNPRRARFNQLAAERRVTSTVSLGQALALCDAVHVDMSRLTRDPHWDRFLRIAERVQQADIQLETDIKERLASSTYLDPATLASMRHDLTLCRARIDARQSLLDLPREVLNATSAALTEQSPTSAT